jgi:hypothetical protein
MLQPQISRDQSGFNGCGIRIVLGVSRRLLEVDFYDFSINFYASSLAAARMVNRSEICRPAIDMLMAHEL